MDEALIELLKEMAASELDGQIEIPRRHDLELERKRHRARLLVDQGHAEWVSRSRVRITASGYEFITELESREAAGKEEERSETKQTRRFEYPAWVNAVAAVVVAVLTALAYFGPIPEPPEWVCSSGRVEIDNIDGAEREIRHPMVYWQDLSDDAQLQGYQVLRAAPHSVFDPTDTDTFVPISGLIPPDTPMFTDSSCPGRCGYRIVSVDVSRRQSPLSQFVHCDVGPDPDDVDCNRSCNDLPKAMEQIERYYNSAN